MRRRRRFGGEVTAADLEGNTYISTSVAGHDLVEGTSVQVSFEDDTISVNAGCNTLLGGYTASDGTLTIGDDAKGITLEQG